jgi:iron complex transport system substrate-binding protein
LKNACILLGCILAMSAASVEAADINYTDKLGRQVNITVPVRKAVIFQTTELIPVLGIWDRVVGVGRFTYDSDILKAAKPDIASAIPCAGSGAEVNIEAILKADPDLVVAWSYYPDQVRFMESKGLRVIALYLDSIPEMYEVMRLHGKLFAKEKKIDDAISQMEGIFNLIKQRTAKIPPDKRKRVLWLYGKPTQVAGKLDLQVALINLIGGNNAASTINMRTAEVSKEQIIAWNPDVIFVWGNAKYESGNILNNPQWRHVGAVKNGRVYKAPKWSTWSPRLAPLALWMAKRTYPEYYRDIDLNRVTDNFMRMVFGVPYAKMTQFKE